MTGVAATPELAAPVSAPILQTPLPAVALPPRTRPSRHRLRWIGGGVALLLAGVGGWYYGVPLVLGPIVHTQPLARVTLVQTLVATGHVATRYRIDIGTQIAGIVKQIPVTDGQTVVAGQTLLVLDGTEARALTQQAEATRQQAIAQDRQRQTLTLPAAEQDLVQATAARVRAEQALARNLSALGLESPAALDDARKAVDMLRAAERSALLSVSSDRRGGSNAQLTASAMELASANLRVVRAREQFRTIVAPRAGVLIFRAVEVGDVAHVGDVLMRLAPAGEMEILVQVDEKQIGRMAVGQSAVASPEAFPATRFDARVRYINPAIDVLRASVDVRLLIPAPPDVLRQDMTVAVEIETGRRPQALVVHVEDVYERSGTAPWVLLVRAGRTARQQVQLGVVSAGVVEVTSGLKVGDLVVPHAFSSLAIGDRVRVRPPPVVVP
ncbi:efflux RND transporter periplasmic adaptor subunit [Gemmatimonas sp.]|uniref:efflux RND transporter periplasmic adaptor subunit n=1 Tax=Gemmatimonas sp. TaxID=1962908 RepID=UPI003342227F